VRLEELERLERDELDDLRVSDVDLVDEDHDVADADLPRQEHVLARLPLRALRTVDEQDRPVHLRRAGDHVLHVVGQSMCA
jgi:hypothetical protein